MPFEGREYLLKNVLGEKNPVYNEIEQLSAPAINFYKMQTFKESRKKELDSRPGNHELNKLAELVSNHSWAEDFYQDVFNQSLVLLESELGYRNWVIFQKTFLDGKRPEEVAAELKCTKRVVYIVQSRTLNKLKEIVAKFIEDSH